MTDINERFMALFNGLPRAHGVYTLPPNAVEEIGKKLKGKGITVKDPVTPELWEKHLSSKQGLGIVPINDDGTVWRKWDMTDHLGRTVDWPKNSRLPVNRERVQ